MRFAAVLVLAIALSSVPRTASGQVSFTSSAAGAASSYRNTVVSWNPIPGAASYHLEIDDDPNSGSPEVDVTVAGTSYALSGERLKLNGQVSWAAYVRINGTRWNAGTFAPSYFPEARSPALAVNLENLVHLAFGDRQTRIHLTTSSDWSVIKRLSLGDTFNAEPANLAVDEYGVAHAFWLEQRPTENRVPYYTNSSTGWNLVRIPGTVSSCSLGGSMVTGGGQVDLFYDLCSGIERWTTTDGVQFTRTPIPNNEAPNSMTAARDGVGNFYVASDRDSFSLLQTSADGWIPHPFGPGRYPAIALTPRGEVHALRWARDESVPNGGWFLYSNSLRGFETWTELPVRFSFINNSVLPLVVDEIRHRVYAAVPGDDGIQICSAAHTGLAIDTGTSWTCVATGNGRNGTSAELDLALAPDGALHAAWGVGTSLGYANSLGSFLATNFSPQVTFGTPSSTTSAAIVPTAISDPDGDDLAGHIQVGRVQDVVSLIVPGTTEPIIHEQYTLRNFGSYLQDPSNQPFTRLEFRVIGGSTSWMQLINRNEISTFPAIVQVRRPTGLGSGTIVGTFTILAWDDTGATISESDFLPSVQLTYSGTLPDEVDISALPVGDSLVAVAAWDGSTSVFDTKLFTKTSGQDQLLLTEP